MLNEMGSKNLTFASGSVLDSWGLAAKSLHLDFQNSKKGSDIASVSRNPKTLGESQVQMFKLRNRWPSLAGNKR